MTTPRIHAICGSNSSQSINRQLMRHAMTLFTDAAVTEFDLRDYTLPVFGVDIEKDPPLLAVAERLRTGLMNADGYLFVLAEHNRGMTAFFKNAMDWASRVDKDFKFLSGKPALILATSPGRGGGINAAETGSTTLTMLGAEIVTKLTLPSFKDNTFADEQGRLVLKNEEYSATLKAAIATLESTVRQKG